MESENILVKKLMIFDLQNDMFKVVKIRGRNKECIVCGENS